MAAADYRLCDVCSGKAFYDANLIYEDQRDAEGRTPYKVAGQPSDWGYCLGYLGDWAVLCDDCSKTHQTRIIEAADVGAVDAATELLAALRAICDSKSEAEEYAAIVSAEALMSRIGSAS